MKQTIVNNLLKRLFLLSLIIISIISCSKEEVKYQKLQGNVFGTTFHIQYFDTINNNYSAEITSLFDEMNNSLSTYHNHSSISQLNDGLSVLKVDSNFINVFKLSKKYLKRQMGILILLWVKW